MVKSKYELGKNKMKRNYNRYPPKIVSKKIVNQYKDSILYQCNGKSGDIFFEVSERKDKFSKNWSQIKDMIDNSMLVKKLINSTDIDSYLHSAIGIKTSVSNRNVVSANATIER